MIKRVVSKRTKLLFIGFGAIGIASVAVVYAPDIERALGFKASAAQAAPPSKLVK